MARLRDLIQITNKPSPAGIRAGNRWVLFLVPLASWPEPYKAKWLRTLRILTALDRRFATAKGTLRQEAEPDEQICMCQNVTGCPFKDDIDGVNPGCTRFIMGICIEATQQINKTPLKLDTVGFLLGVSKQRIDQVYRTAVLKLITHIQNDPVLREYCEHHGLSFGKTD